MAVDYNEMMDNQVLVVLIQKLAVFFDSLENVCEDLEKYYNILRLKHENKWNLLSADQQTKINKFFSDIRTLQTQLETEFDEFTSKQLKVKRVIQKAEKGG